MLRNYAIFYTCQDLLETDYLSVFDHLQGVSPDQEMMPVQIEDLEWPSETTFAYTPFQVVAFRRGEMIAKSTWV